MGSIRHLPLVNLEAEQSLLGACLLDPGLCAETVSSLRPDDFYDLKHVSIFEAITSLCQAGQPADLVSVAESLRSKPGQAGGLAYLASLTDVIPSTDGVRSWQKIISDKARVRRLVKLAEDMIRGARAGDDPESLTGEFYHRLNAETDSSTGPARITPLNVRKALLTLPEHRRFIVGGYIPAGVVGLLSGTGGLGKSYLVLRLAVAIAAKKQMPPFTPEAAGTVLLVNAEDDVEDLTLRLYWTVRQAGFSEDERARLAENLVIIPGRGVVGPLAQLNTAGNPTPSRHYAWLRQQVAKHKPTLLVLDTKSRLYGLEENSNDHSAQWLALLERLIADHPGLSILVVSHTSKASAGSQDAHASRGASAIADNSRFVLSLSSLAKEEARSLGLTEGEGIKLVHAKSSYAMARSPVFFRRGDHGVPLMIDKEQVSLDRLGGALDGLIDLLRRDWPGGIGKRDLERGINEGRNIRDAVLEEVDLAKSLWSEVVRYGLESARLEVIDDPNSGSNRSGKLIRPTWNNTVPIGKFSIGADWKKNEVAN